MQRLTTGHGACMDRKPVAVGPSAAHEALAEFGLVQRRRSGGRCFCSTDRERRRWNEIERRRPRLGHDRVAIEQSRFAVLGAHLEPALERRRKPERDLDRVSQDVRGEPAAGVAAVRGRQWPAEAPFEPFVHCADSN